MTIDVPPRQRWGFPGRGGQSEERGRQQSGSGADQGSEQQDAVLRDSVKPHADDEPSRCSVLVPGTDHGFGWPRTDTDATPFLASSAFHSGHDPGAGRMHTRPRVDHDNIYQLRRRPSPETRRSSATARTSISRARATPPYFTHRFVSLSYVTLVDTRRYVGDKTRRVSSRGPDLSPSTESRVAPLSREHLRERSTLVPSDHPRAGNFSLISLRQETLSRRGSFHSRFQVFIILSVNDPHLLHS